MFNIPYCNRISYTLTIASLAFILAGCADMSPKPAKITQIIRNGPTYTLSRDFEWTKRFGCIGTGGYVLYCDSEIIFTLQSGEYEAYYENDDGTYYINYDSALTVKYRPYRDADRVSKKHGGFFIPKKSWYDWGACYFDADRVVYWGTSYMDYNTAKLFQSLITKK